MVLMLSKAALAFVLCLFGHQNVDNSVNQDVCQWGMILRPAYVGTYLNNQKRYCMRIDSDTVSTDAPRGAWGKHRHDLRKLIFSLLFCCVSFFSGIRGISWTKANYSIVKQPIDRKKRSTYLHSTAIRCKGSSFYFFHGDDKIQLRLDNTRLVSQRCAIKVPQICAT